MLWVFRRRRAQVTEETRPGLFSSRSGTQLGHEPERTSQNAVNTQLFSLDLEIIIPTLRFVVGARSLSRWRVSPGGSRGMGRSRGGFKSASVGTSP